ncbi:DgyrCDS6274 [Dimorphilus gyrociliatus]|uniref:DgyrCDS6274 n=1 Tax=Dimorphilus gyrociliatus TaxID=2664684 RepID=A0A7I8VMJ3_9ANNE|nr:DgyrCDS6274 [Dimorphilus gyrociliatus]
MPSDKESQILKRSGRHIERYTDVGIAGRGKFATVKQCICKETKKLFAAKILNKNKMGKDNRENIEREIKLLQLSKECRLIVQIHEVFETPSVVTILTE